MRESVDCTQLYVMKDVAGPELNSGVYGMVPGCCLVQVAVM